MKVTEDSVKKLVAGMKRQQFPDSALRGFGVRVDPPSKRYPNGRRSFFWCKKINGKPVFVSLGDFTPDAGTVKIARDKANEWSGKAAEWKRTNYAPDKNPFIETNPAHPPESPTLAALVDAYCREHIPTNAN